MELLSRRNPLVAIAVGTVVTLCICCLPAAQPADQPAPAAKPPESLPAGALPKLELKIDGPAEVALDGKVTFELVITNVGKTPARGLLVIDHFDQGLEHTVGESPIERPVSDLGPGESARVGLTFRVTRPGTLGHLVEIASSNKVVSSARSTVSVAGAKQGPAAVPVEAEKPAAPPAIPPGVKPAPGSAFPEIKQKTNEELDRERSEGEFPDLGTPLVENVKELTRLHPQFPVWVDRKNKRVIVLGAVCSRECPLELFACLRTTKDYESVVSVPGRASLVHAGLLAVGAESGSPVQFRPKYVPASGPEIEVTVLWKDASGKVQTARAQDWVREVKTKKAMTYPWVFGGSRIVKNQETGEKAYYADLTGELICVSNFASAMIDLPIESTSSDAELMFETFTERIPPRGTPITLILTPKLKKPAETEPGAKTPAKPELKPAKPELKPAKPESKPAETEGKTAAPPAKAPSKAKAVPPKG